MTPRPHHTNKIIRRVRLRAERAVLLALGYEFVAYGAATVQTKTGRWRRAAPIEAARTRRQLGL